MAVEAGLRLDKMEKLDQSMCFFAPIGGLAELEQIDTEGIRTLAGRAQWISSPSP